MKKVLVTGITGQDGIFLTNILLQKHKEIEIIGVSRNAKNNKSFFKNLNKVNNQIHNLESISLVDLNLLDLNDTSNFIQQIFIQKGHKLTYLNIMGFLKFLVSPLFDESKSKVFLEYCHLLSR